jgi:predicted DNA-binding antitoxin AbrB/MazE fold protein
MLNTVRAVVKEGQIRLLEKLELPEGTEVLVTSLVDDSDSAFWLGVSQSALDKIWDNEEDDVYAELLK